MEQEKKRYAKSYTKISHLTSEEKKDRLREQKRLWAEKYVKSNEYKIKYAEVLHKKNMNKVLKEMNKKRENKSYQIKKNIKKDMLSIQRLLNNVVIMINDLNDNLFLDSTVF